MTEKLCLQWNDFQDNVKNAFGNLRKTTDFTDVTLACEDGQQIEAHKLVLASSSPIFEAILKRHKHSHPLIFMRGITSSDMTAMVDFLYCGEANVDQENLDSFLAFAEELQLKGLQSSTESTEPTETEQKQEYKDQRTKTKEISKFDEHRTDSKRVQNNELALPTPVHISGDLQQLDETVKSMMERSQNLVHNGKRQKQGKICKVCGKEGHPTDIKRHIEANHLEGVSIPCNLCDKISRSRNGLKQHILKDHGHKATLSGQDMH